MKVLQLNERQMVCLGQFAEDCTDVHSYMHCYMMATCLEADLLSGEYSVCFIYPDDTMPN